MKRFLIALALLLVPLCAHAQLSSQLLAVTANSGPPPAYVGPCDAVAGTALHAWGMEACAATYATGSNPAFDFTCTGGSVPSGTINILTTGYADQSTLSSDCGTNTIVITKYYDQIGSVPLNNKTSSPTVVLNCIGSHPCIVTNSTQCLFSTATLTQATPFSWVLSGAVTATPGSNFRSIGSSSGSGFIGATNSSGVEAIAFSGTVLANTTSLLTLNTFYSMIAVLGSSGSISVNGSTVSGSTGTTGISSLPILMAGTGTSCASGTSQRSLMAVMFSGALNSTQISAATSRERSNWGF